MKCRWLAAACVGLLLAAVAHAVEPSSDAAQRQQIKTERAAAEARYKQAEADCNMRFAVSGCIAEAQAQRREALERLAHARTRAR